VGFLVRIFQGGVILDLLVCRVMLDGHRRLSGIGCVFPRINHSNQNGCDRTHTDGDRIVEIMPTLICHNCGEEFKNKNARAKFCKKSECQAKRDQARNEWQKEYEKSKRVSHKAICQNCGELFRRHNSQQVYCNKPECREVQRKRTLKLNKERQKTYRNQEPTKADKICRKCKRPIKGPNYFYCDKCLTEMSYFNYDALYCDNEYPWTQ